MNYPYCKKHKIPLIFDGYASMGSFHSNYYRCLECKKTIEIKDVCLEHRKHFDMNKDYYGIDD